MSVFLAVSMRLYVCVCVCVFAIAYIATKDFTGKLFATGGVWMIIG